MPERNQDQATNNVRVVVEQEDSGRVLSRTTIVEYPDLLNAEANPIGILLIDATVQGLLPLVIRLAEEKAQLLGQGEVFAQFKPKLEELIKKQ